MHYKNEEAFNNTRFIKDNERNHFFNFFIDKSNIAIISHLDPDGDAIASIAAIYYFCKSLSINTKIFLYNHPPFVEYNYWNLNLLNIKELNQDEFEGIIFVDTPSIVRSGLKKEFQIKKPSLCIDHHIDNNLFCEYNIVAPKFCSTSEIIYDIIKDSDFIILNENKIEKKEFINLIYESILMGILFDTYYFQTENVDFILLQRVAELQMKTNSLQKLKNILFKNQNPVIYKFWGYILSTISLHYNDQVVIAKAPKDIFDQFQDKYKDFSVTMATEGFVNHLMNLRNVSIAIFIREIEDFVKVSIRSSIKVASIIANHFGGGGHENAAAFKLSINDYENIEKLEKDILNIIEKNNLILTDRI